MVNKSIHFNYLNNFRIMLSYFLKSGVGIQSVTYPFKDGAIILFDFGLSMPSKDEVRSLSQNLSEALRRTNLFEISSYHREIPGTTIVLSGSKIVVMKTDCLDQWDKHAVRNDLKEILKKAVHKED